MSYSIQKQELEKVVSFGLNHLEILIPDSPAKRGLTQLLSDINNDYFTVVVVGEFKNGKSTFVNALLGESLMPVDVTPTTATINAIFYGENRELHVVKQTGDIERKALSKEHLSNYIVSSDFDPNEIKYLKIFMPSPILENGVVLVDTPGVNDLNQHRSDITHQFIPQADAVLFLVDIRSPFKKTEVEFLEQIVNKEGIQRIIFAANFIDRVDDDEINDSIEYTKRYVQRITKIKNPVVFPFSSLLGLQAKIYEDHEKLERSKIKPLEQAVQELLNGSTKSQSKMDRYIFRVNQLHSNVQAEIASVKHFSNQNIEDLQNQLHAVEDWIAKKDVWNVQIDQYIDERQDDIFYIVRKSILYFSERLKKEVEHRITMFDGPDMKPFIENQLPFYIRSQIEQWTEHYVVNIHDLLLKVENEVSKSLSESFNQNIIIHTAHQTNIDMNSDIPHITANAGNSSIKAGLVIGGASVVALTLGASIFVPLLGMAGYPFIQSKLKQMQMDKVKPVLKYSMDEQVSIVIQSLINQVNLYIEKNIKSIRTNTMHHFEEQLIYMKVTIDEQVRENQSQTDVWKSKIEKLTHFSKQFEEMLNERVLNDE